MNLSAINVREMFKNVRGWIYVLYSKTFKMFETWFMCCKCSWNVQKFPRNVQNVQEKIYMLWLFVNGFKMFVEVFKTFVKRFMCCDCSRTDFCSVNVRENVQKCLKMLYVLWLFKNGFFFSKCLRTVQNVREKIYFVVFLVRCCKMVLKRAVIVKCSKCFQDSKCFWRSKCFQDSKCFLMIKMFQNVFKSVNVKFSKCSH